MKRLSSVRSRGSSVTGKDEREAGRKEGRLEGEEQTMELVNVLMSQGRFEDLKRCLEDRTFREELLEQFGIKGKEK